MSVRIYELPFGKGKQWLSGSGLMDRLVGGWQLGLVWRVASGAPITFIDPRGTLNRAARSGRQTALTNLTNSQLHALIGHFVTPCGVFFVNPTAININQANLAAGNCTALTSGLTTGTTGGVGSSGWLQPTFAGQVFFSNGPNTTSSLRRAVVDGPWLSSADLSLLKNFHITERVNFKTLAEGLTFLKKHSFYPGEVI